MAKNEEGEFELILGNRQLISVFLIVVILLGVFFSMGYIVGRNSAPGATTETARNAESYRGRTSQKASPAPSSPTSFAGHARSSRRRAARGYPSGTACRVAC